MDTYLLPPREFVRTPHLAQREYTTAESLAYSKWLANVHYENFHVVSFLLPKRLHQDFYNIYAFCRWADDLGDEMDSPEESLRLLDWWRTELHAMYAGRAGHPVFVALRETVQKHDIPMTPFDDLITAFVQDQTVTRYEDYDGLAQYCRYSANPVGRLVLMLCGYRDEERQRLSDATCTALQLANFWQDVSVDLQKGRVYLPQEAMRRHGYSMEDLEALRFTPGFRGLMQEVVAHARELFYQGAPLVKMVDRRLSIDLDLFTRGGLCILDKIEAQGFDVLSRRPAISKGERVRLLLQSIFRRPLVKAA